MKKIKEKDVVFFKARYHTKFLTDSNFSFYKIHGSFIGNTKETVHQMTFLLLAIEISSF